MTHTSSGGQPAPSPQNGKDVELMEWRIYNKDTFGGWPGISEVITTRHGAVRILVNANGADEALFALAALRDVFGPGQ